MTNINGQDLSNFSMLDLFRSEVEMHTGTLNDCLLAMENGAGTAENVEALMRAAHSIKGGARIVELDMVVKLSHIMEDCFVTLQKGEGHLRAGLQSDDIDILLKGVDVISRISDIASDDLDGWIAEHRDTIDYLISAISGIITGETVRHPPPPEPEPEPETAEELPPETATQPPGKTGTPESELPRTPDDDNDPKPETPSFGQKSEKPEFQPKPRKRVRKKPAAQRSADKNRMIRVTAVKIERLMGLAGEVVVSARWLPPFSKSLLKLKKSHVELSAILEKLHEVLDYDDFHPRNAEFEIGNSKDELRKMVSRARGKIKECNHYLLDRLNRLDMFTSSSENLSDRLYHEVIRVRMRPFSDGIRGFPRMVRDLARELGKKVRLEIVGENTEVDRDILEKLDAPLTHLIRNALDHGIESPHDRLARGKSEVACLRLEAAHRSGILMITVSDDGQGVNLDELRGEILEKGLTSAEMIGRLTEPELMDFLFLPGFSTVEKVTDISGRGVGLDVVHSMVHEVGGVVRAVSKPDRGLTFNMELPLTLSVIRTFLVDISGEPYAFPLARIDRCLVIHRSEIDTVEDREYFRLDDRNIALVDIHDVLEISHRQTDSPAKNGDPEYLNVIMVSDRLHAYGLVVDHLLGEYDLVVRPMDPRLGKVPDINAVAIMLDGSPVLIFDIEDLVRSIDGLLTGKRLQKIGHSPETEEKKSKNILVVDDSITVREMERKLLESRGYQVDVAVDGMDAWNLLRIVPFDMVVSDVDMPRMNGIELIKHIKGHDKLKSLPVMIVSYKNKEEDRLRGLEAGANYYLTKTSFQDNSFIDAVTDLVGEA